MDRSFPCRRRAGVALGLFLVLAGSGTAAEGLGILDHRGPATFEPAQPLPGDEAEYHYVRIDASGPSENALPWFRYEHLGPTFTMDTDGNVVLAELARTHQAELDGYGPAGTTRVPHVWDTQTVADTPNGTIWSEASVRQEHDGGGLLVLDGTVVREERRRGYWDGEGRLHRTCLQQTLPAGFDVAAPQWPVSECRAATPWEHPDQTVTGRDLRARENVTGGIGLSSQPMTVRGTADTQFGRAIVLSSQPLPEWTVEVWYTEEVPYPVRLAVTVDGTASVFDLVSFTRGQDAPPGRERPDTLPPLEWVAPPAWGLADAGLQLGWPPSAAWQALLADEERTLASFIDEHPSWYTEHVVGGASGGSAWEWEFQARASDDRLRLGIRRTLEDPWAPYPSGGPDTQFTTEIWNLDPLVIPDSTGVPPGRVPSMRSVAARLDAFFDAPATWFQYTWDCNRPTSMADWAHCDAGPVVHAAGGTASTGSAEGLLAWFLDGRRDDVVGWISHLPDGDLGATAQFSTRQHRETTEPVPPPRAASAVTPAEGWQMPSLAAAARVSVGAAILATLYLLWPQVKFATVALFSRATGPELLAHPTRRAIIDAVAATPGVHLSALAARLGRPRGSTDYHVRRLAADGLVRLRREHGSTCVYPSGASSREVVPPRLTTAVRGRLLASLVATPGLRAAELARRLGIGRSAVRHHADQLVSAGLVERRRDGRAVWYSVTTRGRLAHAAKDMPRKTDT